MTVGVIPAGTANSMATTLGLDSAPTTRNFLFPKFLTFLESNTSNSRAAGAAALAVVVGKSKAVDVLQIQTAHAPDLPEGHVGGPTIHFALSGVAVGMPAAVSKRVSYPTWIESIRYSKSQTMTMLNISINPMNWPILGGAGNWQPACGHLKVTTEGVTAWSSDIYDGLLFSLHTHWGMQRPILAVAPACGAGTLVKMPTGAAQNCFRGGSDSAPLATWGAVQDLSSFVWIAKDVVDVSIDGHVYETESVTATVLPQHLNMFIA